jgi:hypothetical protein
MGNSEVGISCPVLRIRIRPDPIRIMVLRNPYPSLNFL